MGKCFHSYLIKGLIVFVLLLAGYGLFTSGSITSSDISSIRNDQNNKPDIDIKVERLDTHEQRKLFGKSSKFLFDSSLNDPLVLLRLSVVNNSDKKCILNPKDFINSLSSDDAIKNMKIKAGHQWGKSLLIGAGIGSSAGFIIEESGDILFCCFSPFTFIVAGLLIGLTSGIIPGVGFSIRAAVINGRMKKDLKRNSIIGEPVIVDVGSQYEGLVLVKQSDYRENFYAVVHQDGLDNECMVFNVKVNN